MADDNRGIVPPTTGSSAVSPGASDAGRHDAPSLPVREEYTARDTDTPVHHQEPVHQRTEVLQEPVHQRTEVVQEPVHQRTEVHHTEVVHDRDGDGRDDRTGAVLPGSAKEMAAAQRARYGGLKMGSAFFGWMCSVGISVILLALLSAAGLVFGLNATVTDAQSAADQASTGIGIGAAIALLVVLFLAYLAGGYVAGRMARFNGIKQGLGVWLWGLIITVLVAVAGLVLGSQYNVFDQLNLPALPVESGTATTAGLIALAAVLVVTLLGALLGGRLGSRYHRRVDRAAFEPVDA